MEVASYRRIYGVDFSGAKDAGHRVWIARGAVEKGVLLIEACYQAKELPGSGKGREQSLPALRDLIARENASAFGLDFPFGLPQALVKEKSWEDFILSFPDNYASPEEFRHLCRESSGGRELRRVTDRESLTPFSPYNVRLYRQTYYGIRDVLYPLVRDQLACVLPMQSPLLDRPWILEICPASTLKLRWKDVYLPYKDRTDEHRAARARILERLEAVADVSIPAQAVRSRVLDDPGGDALDSVVAAFATFKALRDPDLVAAKTSDACALEGFVYI